MNEIVFKPKHNWLLIAFQGLLFVLFAGTAFLIGYARNNTAAHVIGFVFILLGLYSVARRSTLIIIGTTEVVMKRVLLPALVLEYDNFTDFTGFAFIFGRTGIPLDDMTNAKEFTDIFLPVLEKRDIQSTGEYAAGVVRTNKALKYAVIPSVITTIVATYFLKRYLHVQYDRELVGGAIFLVMLFGVYLILKKLEEFNKE